MNEPGASGYADPGYAASLAEFGQPRALPRSGGWLLERGIAGAGVSDAMGCYPLFACYDWRALQTDLDKIRDLVCVSLVTDPFGAYDQADLLRCFGERAVRFKEHFVADLGKPLETAVSKHHQYRARTALAAVTVERCAEPARFLDEWTTLYEHLTARHHLKGIKAFSRSAFEAQLSLPGMVMLRARYNGQTVAAHLWLKQGDVIHGHLAASSQQGYKLAASYAIYWTALQLFADEARWLNLGAGAGLRSDAMDGLTQFKRGWATETRTSYFCGRIFDHQRYEEIVRASNQPASNFFPAYRQGEFD